MHFSLIVLECYKCLRLWSLESIIKKSKSTSHLFIFTDVFVLLEDIVGLDVVSYVLQA